MPAIVVDLFCALDRARAGHHDDVAAADLDLTARGSDLDNGAVGFERAAGEFVGCRNLDDFTDAFEQFDFAMIDWAPPTAPKHGVGLRRSTDDVKTSWTRRSITLWICSSVAPSCITTTINSFTPICPGRVFQATAFVDRCSNSRLKTFVVQRSAIGLLDALQNFPFALGIVDTEGFPHA